MEPFFNNRIRQVLLFSGYYWAICFTGFNLYAFLCRECWGNYLVHPVPDLVRLPDPPKHWNKVFTAILFMLLFIIGLGIPVLLLHRYPGLLVNTVFSTLRIW